jgi:hypothetical protein
MAEQSEPFARVDRPFDWVLRHLARDTVDPVGASMVRTGCPGSKASIASEWVEDEVTKAYAEEEREKRPCYSGPYRRRGHVYWRALGSQAAGPAQYRGFSAMEKPGEISKKSRSSPSRSQNARGQINQQNAAGRFLDLQSRRSLGVSTRFARRLPIAFQNPVRCSALSPGRGQGRDCGRCFGGAGG